MPPSLLRRLREREGCLSRPRSPSSPTPLPPPPFTRHTTPRTVVHGISLPSDIRTIRGFTPDGKRLLCFPRHYQGIEIRKFNGLDLEAHDLNTTTLFTRIFPFEASLSLSSSGILEGERFHSHFTLFHPDGDKVLLASLTPHSDGDEPPSRRHPSSLQHNHPLADIRFYTLDLSGMKLRLAWTFPVDWILLDGNRCCSLEGKILSIHSLQDQMVHVFRWGSQGDLEVLYRLGPHLTGAEEEAEAAEMARQPDLIPSSPPSHLQGLTQKLVTRAYRDAVADGGRERISHFHRICPQLIEGLSLSQATLQGPSGRYLRLQYIPTTSIHLVLQIAPSPIPPCSIIVTPPVTPLTAVYDVEERCFSSLRHGPAGGRPDLHPPPNQGTPPLSPYLDPELFSYDESIVLGRDRPQQGFDAHVRVRFGDTRSLAYTLPPPVTSHLPPADLGGRSSSYSSMVWHPTAPLFISVIYVIDAQPSATIYMHAPGSEPIWGLDAASSSVP